MMDSLILKIYARILIEFMDESFSPLYQLTRCGCMHGMTISHVSSLRRAPPLIKLSGLRRVLESRTEIDNKW